MRDGGGKPFAVVFASLRLTSLERESPNSVDSEARITILDRNGVILLASDPLSGGLDSLSSAPGCAKRSWHGPAMFASQQTRQSRFG